MNERRRTRVRGPQRVIEERNVKRKDGKERKRGKGGRRRRKMEWKARK